MTVLSSSDVILVAIPMVGVLIACFFRLGEMLGKPKKRVKMEHRGQMFEWDEHGQPLCADPDGSGAKPIDGRMVTVRARVRRDWSE